MTPGTVRSLVDSMGAGYARQAFAAYLQDVLGPIAARIKEAPEDGNDDEALLGSLRDGLGAGLLDSMASAGLVDSLTAAGVHASLIGRAAVPEPESD